MIFAISRGDSTVYVGDLYFAIVRKDGSVRVRDRKNGGTVTTTERGWDLHAHDIFSARKGRRIGVPA
jgi:hypothetical protein